MYSVLVVVDAAPGRVDLESVIDGSVSLIGSVSGDEADALLRALRHAIDRARAVAVVPSSVS